MADVSGGQIGPYKLLERIGEGGFGTVYLAEQREPVQRRVALKVIKPGMDSKSVIARFEAERQALALMNHPHIATVLDAGTTDAGSPLRAGHPYFVMELVHGIPITQFCDDEKLTIRARLALFEDVCQAVQHAHMKGIIHRDLKPSNVLVTRLEGKPVVKVIDFGIAKATQGRLTEKTLFTEFRQLIGTPAYMSPEQAQMSGIDVDTRSDIYSLGVLLYELLTGTTPFDSKTLQKLSYDEMRRIVREIEPQRPSARVSTLRVAKSAQIQSEPTDDSAGAGYSLPEPGPAASSQITDVALRRCTNVRSLSKQLHGELDWIVMKCLEKDRARRYDTASGLAGDLNSFLNGEPVLAAPPSRLYRLRKVLHRHRLPIAAGTAVLLLILGATAVSTLLWQRAEHESSVAQDEADKAQQISRFLQSMLTSISPERVEGRDLSLLLEVLDGAARRVDADFAERPEIRATLHMTIGKTYERLSKFDAAEQHYRAALAIRRKLHPGDHPETADSIHALAKLLEYQHVTGDAEARALIDEGLAMRRRLFGDDNPATAESLYLWARVSDRGFESDIETFKQILAVRRKWLGNDHPDVAHTLHVIGNCLSALDRYDEAESYYRESLEIRRRTLPPNHPSIISGAADLAGHLAFVGKFDEAARLSEEALERARQYFPPEHDLVAVALLDRGYVLVREERAAEAEPILREALRIRKNCYEEGHWRIASAQSVLGEALAKLGRYEEAEALLLDAFAVLEPTFRIHSGNHWLVREAARCLAELYEAWNVAQPEKRHDVEAAVWRARLAELSRATGVKP